MIEKYEEVVDSITGEVIKSTRSKTFYKKKETGLFLQWYCKSVAALADIREGATLRVWLKTIEVADMSNGEVLIPSPLKKQIIDSLGISLSAFDKAIKDLKRANIIEGSRGMYRLNPDYFWFGTSEERDKILSGKTKCAITISAFNPDDFENDKDPIF